MTPRTRYAKSGDLNIAYQVVGDGPLDLVYAPGWVSNIEMLWEEPRYARFLERLASFTRLIVFDKRGTGLSDRVPIDQLPTLEQRADDVRAVLDAVGSKRAALFGVSESGSLCLLYAAMHPDRVAALVLFSSFAKRLRSADYPWAPTYEERMRWVETLETEWGTEDASDLMTLAPSAQSDPALRHWLAAYRRRSASPGTAVALGRMNSFIDTRAVLPTISVPTMVLHPVGDEDVQVAEGRYLAEHILGARFVELPGRDHAPWTENADRVIQEIQEFLTGTPSLADADRYLTTVLFTDIVDGTKRAASLGDRAWRALVERHHDLVRRELQRHRGVEMDTAGDGFFATFDGPARAVRCALAVRDGVRDLGLAIRAGVHTGECETIAGKAGGIAVIIGARVRERAQADEVLASSTVRDLVSGSGLQFDDRGSHELKGVPGEWHLFAAS